MLLLTAQRLEKIVDLQWDDISSEGVWKLRTEEGEKGNIGAVELPDSLCVSSARSRVLPTILCLRRAERAKCFTSKNKAAFDQACGVTGWRLHDLRRNGASPHGPRGREQRDAEKVMGHALGGVEGFTTSINTCRMKSKALRKLAALIERDHQSAGGQRRAFA